MFFDTVTLWQTPNYLLRVQCGIFPSKEKAEEFLCKPLVLERDGDRLVVRAGDAGTELDEAFDENIAVFKIKESSLSAKTVTMDDYEVVTLSIKDFDGIKELSSFDLAGSYANEIKELILSIPH